MKNAVLALFLVPLLTMPAFADSLSDGDKPMSSRKAPMSESAASELGSVSDTAIGTILLPASI